MEGEAEKWHQFVGGEGSEEWWSACTLRVHLDDVLNAIRRSYQPRQEKFPALRSHGLTSLLPSNALTTPASHAGIHTRSQTPVHAHTHTTAQTHVHPHAAYTHTQPPPYIYACGAAHTLYIPICTPQLDKEICSCWSDAEAAATVQTFVARTKGKLHSVTQDTHIFTGKQCNTKRGITGIECTKHYDVGISPFVMNTSFHAKLQYQVCGCAPRRNQLDRRHLDNRALVCAGDHPEQINEFMLDMKPYH